MPKKKKKKGFTLIELLVVIAIIGILSAIVLVSVNSARTKAKEANVKSNVESTRVAAEIYYDGAGAGSYANVCSSTDFTRINTATTGQGATVVCGSAAGGYCFKGTLGSMIWCADSTGYSGTTGTSCTATTSTACQ